MIEQLPALQIVVPLLTAPLCVILRRPRACWALAMGATWFAFLAAWRLLAEVRAAGPISYQLGGWPPPGGIEYRVDVLNAFVLLIVTGVSALVLTACPRSLAKEVPEGRQYLFFAAYLLAMTGLLGMAITGDAFNLFVFLEISSLSSYALISMGRSRRALTSAFQYLVLGTLGGTFILLGIGLLYMVTGTLNMADLAAQPVGANRTVLVALACIGVGTSIKLAVFPLHIWLPNAYTFAPSVVTALLAATATKVAYYVLVRFVFGIFGVELAFERMHLDAVLMPLAVTAMLVASTVAILQTDLKRMLAYSSVAQVGYMVLGLSFASRSGLTGGIVHMFNHALMKSALFLCIACMVLQLGSSKLEDLRGVGRRMPWTSAAFVISGLSLIGVPLTGGFVSKWFLVSAALEAHLWPVAVLILLSSLLAVVYVWRFVETAYLREAPKGAQWVGEAPMSLLLPTWLLALGTIVFGITTSLNVSVAGEAAAFLLGMAP